MIEGTGAPNWNGATTGEAVPEGGFDAPNGLFAAAGAPKENAGVVVAAGVVDPNVNAPPVAGD